MMARAPRAIGSRATTSCSHELDRATPSVTRPAGLVARVAAALLDLLVTVPFVLVAELLPWELMIDNGVILIPGLWLYGTLATWRFGRTLGKALLDLEVIAVGRPRGRPPLGVAALRHAIYLAPVALVILLREVARASGSQVAEAVGPWATLAAFLWPLAALAWVSWRRPDKRAPWDRLAGTMVRYRRPDPGS